MRLYDGEEAIAVSVPEALTLEDAIVAANREHGHALIRGGAGGRRRTYHMKSDSAA